MKVSPLLKSASCELLSSKLLKLWMVMVDAVLLLGFGLKNDLVCLFSGLWYGGWWMLSFLVSSFINMREYSC